LRSNAERLPKTPDSTLAMRTSHLTAAAVACIVVVSASAPAVSVTGPIEWRCEWDDDSDQCACGQHDLRAMRNQGVFTTPADNDGYAYMFSFCREIPALSLPASCRQTQHGADKVLLPAAVRFLLAGQNNKSSDCSFIGSLSTADGAMGMTAAQLDETHVRITFPYDWGCEEKFTLTLGPGMQALPGAGTFDAMQCKYAYDWPCLDYYEPKACVVTEDSCSCDGVDLGGLFGQVRETPADKLGYRVKFKVCGVLTESDLPSGCSLVAGGNPSVVKYKNGTGDCTEIGSLGPCEKSQLCGMSGKANTNGVDVTYSYTYGCTNILTVKLTKGRASAPLTPFTSDSCAYMTTWPALGSSHCAAEVSSRPQHADSLDASRHPLPTAVRVSYRVGVRGYQKLAF
jgi:hypothetical protein